VVLPPFVDIRSVQTAVDAGKYPLAYGAQDLSVHESGAYTGEVSGPMIAALGATYVAVGHSERRQYHGEREEITNAKNKAALAAGLVPIFCVGEPLEERQAGKQVEYTLAQVEGGLEGLSAEQVAGLVIAYEPVWAIGTGEVATPDDPHPLRRQRQVLERGRAHAEARRGRRPRGRRLAQGRRVRQDRALRRELSRTAVPTAALPGSGVRL
jgi:triosephosphate isomerase